MHLTAYAVTHILADDAVAVALNVILNSSADIGYPVALLRELDALEEALSCNLDEFSGFVADLATGIGACAVTNKALLPGMPCMTSSFTETQALAGNPP